MGDSGGTRRLSRSNRRQRRRAHENVPVRRPVRFEGRRTLAGKPPVAALAAALVLLAGCEDAAPVAGPGAGTPQRLPTATIRVGDVPLEVEVADAEEEHRKGMMFRRRLEPDEAMLFVFAGERDLAFHMRNCYVDLDLAYIAADGRIIEITRMHAHRREPVYSREPARFALEVPAGWFADHGITEGDRVTVPPAVTEGPAG